MKRMVSVMVSGLVLHLYGKVCLARSFGLVAANRGVQRLGPYRVIRHPIYAGYVITQGATREEALDRAASERRVSGAARRRLAHRTRLDPSTYARTRECDRPLLHARRLRRYPGACPHNARHHRCRR